MRSTQQFSITLPNEMAEAVRAKVAAGEYATESEVIRDGLRVLLARDRAVEDWLRKDVAAAYDKLKADPSRAVAVGAVKARLAAAHEKATKKAPGQGLIPYRVVFAPGGQRPARRAVRRTSPSAGHRRSPSATPARWSRPARAWRCFRCAACRAKTSAPAFASPTTRDAP